MVVKILKYNPHSVHKIEQRTFDNARNRAGTYVYYENDRIKKICSQLDQNIDVIKKVGQTEQDKLSFLQIILLDPTQEKILQIRKEMIEIGKQEMSNRILLYNRRLEELDRAVKRVDKECTNLL